MVTMAGGGGGAYIPAGGSAYGMGFGYGQAIPTQADADKAMKEWLKKHPKPKDPYTGAGFTGYFSSGTATKPAPYTQIPTGPVGAKSAASPTPSSLIDSLLDPNKMAAAEFDPQYQLLNQLRAQAEARYGKAGRDVSGMYAQLADEFRGQEGAIKGQYSSNASALKGQLNSATSALAADMAKSRQEIADRAARMGTAEGVNQLGQESAGEQNQYAGLLNAISQNYQGLNTAQQSSDVSYNRNVAETTDLMGSDAAQAFQMKLMEALQGYGNKELELKGAQAAAENKYALENQSQMSAQEKARADAELGQAKLAQEMEIAKLRYGQKSAAAAEPDYNKLPADVAISTMAQKLYGTPEGQRNAVAAILDTFQRGAKSQGYKRNWSNLTDFLDALRYRNQGATDWDKLAALGSLYFSKLSGGANKSYGFDQYGNPAQLG